MEHALAGSELDCARRELECLVAVVDAPRAEEVVYDLVPRQASFEDWLRERRAGAIVGTVDEVVERLKRLESLGVDGAMLQHLRHEDLEAVALIGRELVPALA